MEPLTLQYREIRLHQLCIYKVCGLPKCLVCIGRYGGRKEIHTAVFMTSSSVKAHLELIIAVFYNGQAIQSCWNLCDPNTGSLEVQGDNNITSHLQMTSGCSLWKCVWIYFGLPSRECAQIHLKSNITPDFLLASCLLVQTVRWMIDYESRASFQW